jgi:hypothetical protein
LKLFFYFLFYNENLELKLLDSTFGPDFLTSLFNEMKEPGTNYVCLDKIIKEFDVYRKEGN